MTFSLSSAIINRKDNQMLRFTKHALEQMSKRNITKSNVASAIRNGVHMINKHNNTKTTIIDNKQRLYIVCNKEASVVITTFWSN